MLIPVIARLWCWVRYHPGHRPHVQVSAISPHLQNALQVGGTVQHRLQPIDGAHLGAGLLTLAVSGPTWTREPNLLLANSAPLVVAPKSDRQRAKH